MCQIRAHPRGRPDLCQERRWKWDNSREGALCRIGHLGPITSVRMTATGLKGGCNMNVGRFDIGFTKHRTRCALCVVIPLTVVCRFERRQSVHAIHAGHECRQADQRQMRPVSPRCCTPRCCPRDVGTVTGLWHLTCGCLPARRGYSTWVFSTGFSVAPRLPE